MTASTLPDLLREDRFPGNTTAYEELRHFVQQGAVTVFSGAGVSSPLIPTWNAFLTEELDRCLRDGIIPRSDEEDYRLLLANDPLEFAESIEQVTVSAVFRAKLSERFRNNSLCTPCQECIVQLPVRSIVTLNYDFGHEVAYGKTGHFPASGRAQDRATLDRWSQFDLAESPVPILHLHGDSTNAESIVLTSSDYDKFYNQAHVESFISQLWRTQNLLVVGFGFTDPFLTRLAEKTLRSLVGDHRHFAFIGCRDGLSPSAIARQIFTRKYRLRPVFYEVKGANGEDHSALLGLLRGVSTHPSDAKGASVATIVVAPPAPANAAQFDSSAEQAFRNDLYVAPNKNTLYVEPRFHSTAESEGDTTEIEYTVADIVGRTSSIIMSCKPEYGATAAGRRIAFELSRIGSRSIFCDASTLPKYKKKLEAFFEEKGLLSNVNNQVLILDNFNSVSHERLLKEIIGLKVFSRVILLAMESMFEAHVSMSLDHSEMRFETMRLAPLSRADVRKLTIQFYDTSDSDHISAIVEKIYTDLVTLCIPITPSNVIMYLTIILKDGDFQPLNRVQIVNRYLNSLLSRPSDAMAGSFTAKNKMDLLSAFVFSLEKADKQIFTEHDWVAFCRKHMLDTLTLFDERQLLETLKSTRVLVSFRDELFFKYSFFHTFFLGRHVAHKPSLFESFRADNSYLRHAGLVEVMSDLTPDNEPLFNDIIEKLESVLAEFDQKYIPNSFDPFSEIDWPNRQDENEKLWKPINDRLASGPRNAAEIDEIKRSLTDENRSENQNVVVQNFDRLEKRLVLLQCALADAIHNADNLPGVTKKRAVLSLLKSFHIYMQVGLILAPVIATRPYFRWHGLAFVNFHLAANAQDEKRRTISVMFALISAVVDRAAEQIGSRKIGEVFKAIADDPEIKGFARVLNFAAIVRSKPKQWKAVANAIIAATGRNEFYLYEFVKFTNNQFHHEVNTNAERDDLKQVIAMLQLKRTGKNTPAGEKDLRKTVAKLDSRGAFDAS